jgi:hypothetical protein
MGEFKISYSSVSEAYRRATPEDRRTLSTAYMNLAGAEKDAIADYHRRVTVLVKAVRDGTIGSDALLAQAPEIESECFRHRKPVINECETVINNIIEKYSNPE